MPVCEYTSREREDEVYPVTVKEIAEAQRAHKHYAKYFKDTNKTFKDKDSHIPIRMKSDELVLFYKGNRLVIFREGKELIAVIHKSPT